MTNQVATARAAIASEIKHLASEQAKLERVLAQLQGDSEKPVAAVKTATPKAGKARRGRPPSKNKAKTSSSDLSSALKLIEKAGKKGLKALKLAYEIKVAGGSRPEKAELLGSKKVKLVGKGGGATYIWTA